MAKVKKDIYVNRAIQRVTMSAVNVLTFQKLNFAVGIFQGVAILIHRIIYHIGTLSWDELANVGDLFQVAMTVSDQLSDIAMTHIEVIDEHEYVAYLNGVPANAIPTPTRIITEFSNLPGGGMIVAANPIFLAMNSATLVTAGVCDVELLFTFIELSDADYIELIQSRIQANV